MSSVVSPGSVDEALQMLTAAMGYLAAADATAMTEEEQARCLRVLERVNSTGTAARTSVLSAFASGQGYSADADYSEGRDGTTGGTITHGDGSSVVRARQRPLLSWMARPASACSLPSDAATACPGRC